MTKPSWWLVHVVNELAECETSEQALDVDNERYIRTNVLGVPITITSARKKPSNYRDGIYAVIGFIGPKGHGQFTIGNNGARLPLYLQRFDRLPADVTLYTANTPHGPIYKWRRTNAR